MLHTAAAHGTNGEERICGWYLVWGTVATFFHSISISYFFFVFIFIFFFFFFFISILCRLFYRKYFHCRRWQPATAATAATAGVAAGTAATECARARPIRDCMKIMYIFFVYFNFIYCCCAARCVCAWPCPGTTVAQRTHSVRCVVCLVCGECISWLLHKI